MKKHLKNLLALLLCAALMCGAFAALADEIQIQVEGPVIKDIDPLDGIGLTLDSAVITEQDLTLNNIGALRLETTQDNAMDFQVTGNPSIQTNGSRIETKYRDDGFDIVLIEETDITYTETPLESYQFTENKTAVIVRHLSNSGERELVIPASVQGYPIVGIGVENIRTLDNEDVLETVSLPEGLKWIGPHVFWGCTKLTTINIPNTVTQIGSCAFIDCTALETITLPNSLISIDRMAFKGSGLKSITIPEGVTSIDNSAFEDCDSLQSVKIPGTLQSIPYFLFNRLPALENVSISYGVKVIEQLAFSNCPIKEIIIPGSVEVIEDYAFSDCLIKEIIIPGSVEVIGENAFGNCPLVSLTIQDGVKSIADQAFLGAKLQRVTIPASVTSIGWHAFGYCRIPGKGDQPIEGFTICGKAGTAAEKYAEENGFEFDDGTIEPKSITITNGKNKKLEVGEKLQLKTSLKPRDAKTTLTWKSSDENVATVSAKGLVKAVGKGKATVTVTTANGKTAKITIKVIARKPSKVTITNGKKATVAAGKTLQLKTKLSPADAETKLTWKSSNTKVATVSSKGLVKGIKAGKAKITVKTANGKSATITITVK